ncbi:PepSY-associated TM helix domain-containing protein [Burkholderia alba]|uniref:PepSY-associated TM helix domain-containing protein n=1 Tax=Burkholderia alba TaxID=2683677 RepID=UPI002B05FCED|nr:PepSY-associated TM helix domain-containing protein [Burkholderia alba]
MRPWFVRLHRWFGIGTALFLFLAGLTGAIIAWDHELDALINPEFFHARSDGAPLAPIELANRIERADPRVQVTYLPLAIEPGHTLQVGLLPRTDPGTGAPFALDFNQLAIDPGTGDVQARREWGAVSVAPLELIPFIYRLHYSLHLPMTGGVDLGIWVMGIVSIIWLVDSVIALVLAFPSLKSWRKSFGFRVARGGYALVFDLHRSGGVWVWGLLIVVAFTSVSMNLGNPVVRPLVGMMSPLAATPFTNPERYAPARPGVAPITRERMLAIATEAARAEGIEAPAGGMFYSPALNVYAVGFFRPGNDHGDVGLGNPWLYWDATTGRRVASMVPGRGSAGDIFMQAQFPLHSGRIAGLPGRVLVSALGVVIAMLSVTGLWIWLKKRHARRRPASVPAKAGGRERAAS